MKGDTRDTLKTVRNALLATAAILGVILNFPDGNNDNDEDDTK